MRNFSKKLIVAFLSIMMVFTTIPFTANAEDSTLGTETPSVTATYTNSDGNKADGNALTSGTYTMTISVAGMQNLSEMQFTSTYDSNIIAFGEYTSISDTYSTIQSQGIVLTAGSFIIGFVSENHTYTAIDTNGTVLVAISLTITSDTAVDMNDTLVIDTDPDKTYFEANYADVTVTDGVYNYPCYALGTSDTHQGTVYDMTCDLSPVVNFDHSVSGTVVTMESPDGTAPNAYPLEEVDVIINDETVATTDENGVFTIDALEPGTYTATLSYLYGYDRTISIVVSTEDITYETPIPMVACNFSKDNLISTADTKTYKVALQVYNKYCDFDNNGIVSTADTKIYNRFLMKGSLTDSIYTNVTIQ